MDVTFILFHVSVKAELNFFKPQIKLLEAATYITDLLMCVVQGYF